MDILKRIEDIRKARKMSIYELAKKSGISHNTIYRWYTLNYTPSFDSLMEICEKGFNMQMIEFFAIDSELIPATEEFKEIANLWFKLNNRQKQTLKQMLLSFQIDD